MFSEFGSDYIKVNINRLNDFWKDVFLGWIRFSNSFRIDSVEDFLSEPIWLNPKLCVGRRGILINSMYNRGVKFINDLIDINGEILTLNQLNIKLNTEVNFLEYAGLVRALNMFKRQFHFPERLSPMHSPFFSKYYQSNFKR